MNENNDYKQSDELNARIREGLSPKLAKELFDQTSKFNEELNKFVIKAYEEGVPPHFIIGSMTILGNSIISLDQMKQIEGMKRLDKED